MQRDPVMGREDGPVKATITNTFESDDFTVTKVVDGDGAPFVPDGTDYTVEVSCEYLGAPVSGFDPLPVLLRTPDQLSQTVGPLPLGADCTVVEVESNGAGMTSVVPDSVTVGEGEVPVEVVVTNTYDTGSLVINKVINGPIDLVQGSFEFDVTCAFLGAALDPQPGIATITPPASSVTVDGLPVGAECAVAELPPFGGADGPGVVEPGSVVIESGDPVSVTATNTFTPPPVPPQPQPQPPTMPATGAGWLAPVGALAVSLVLTGAALVTWAVWRRREQVTDA